MGLIGIRWIAWSCRRNSLHCAVLSMSKLPPPVACFTALIVDGLSERAAAILAACTEAAALAYRGRQSERECVVQALRPHEEESSKLYIPPDYDSLLHV